MNTARPLAPVEDFGPAGDRDHAKDGYPLAALESRIQDCIGQPDWRPRSDLAHAYYDMGKQLSPERMEKIRKEMGIEPRQTNLVHGVINGVLGQEAKQRSDVRIEADDDDFQDVSDVLSMRMKEATRESNADMAISNGYAGQCKGGIGWVEVSRAMDPLDYPYRVTDVHRREIWYDWRSKDIGLKDATWLVRKRWEDLDESCALMPQFKDVLKHAVNNDWDMVQLPEENDAVYRFYQTAFSRERSFTNVVRRDDWCDSTRKRIKFFEVWYRVPAKVVVVHVGATRRLVYDENNPIHVEAVARGAKVSQSITRQVRMALFAGPHRLIDVGTTRRSFPYIPFFAFRDDEDRSPYGLIEGMIAPQDGFNDRRQMVDWMLRARQTYIDNDALDTDYNSVSDIKRTAGRPDFTVVLSAQRKKEAGVRIESQLALEKAQLEAMGLDQRLIQEVPRIYSTQLGDAPSGVTSGIAINSLTEAGAVAMGELNDNYRYARKAVHDQVLDLIVEDHSTEDLQVMMGSGQSRRVIVLNTWTPEGAPMNRVKDAPVKVGMTDIPTSPAFRMQEQQLLGQMIQAMQGNPAALNLLSAAYLEGSSLTNRQQMADDFRRATGQAVAGDRQAQAAQQAKLEEQQAKDAIAKNNIVRAELEKTVAEVEKTKSETELNHAKAVQMGFDMGSKHADANRQAAEAANDPEAQQQRLIDESIAEARAPALA